jgi:predicted nucleic acid-binding protein
MGWVEDLKGKVVGLDTSPFIYYVKRYAAYIDMLREFFQAVDRGEILIVTSVITLLETLAQPLKKGDIVLAEKYRTILLHTKGLEMAIVSSHIAEGVARLRARYNLRTPDTIQMATAIDINTPFFLTNDMKLPSSTELQVLKLDELRSL